MKHIAYMSILMLFFAAGMVVVRCEETLVNSQPLLDDSQPSKTYYGDLKAGEVISINLDVTQGTVNFHILGAGDSQLLDKYNVGTEGWQGQYSVVNDGEYEFVTERSGTGSTIVHVTVIASGGTDGAGGGFDPVPAVVAVVIVLILIIVVFFIFHLRRQAPPPPPPSP